MKPGAPKISNPKFQISSKFQIQITKQILFGIWVIGIYLEFGAWGLVLFLGMLCAMPYHMREQRNEKQRIGGSL